MIEKSGEDMNKQTIWEYLKSKGFSNVAAAALMGNMEAESNCVAHRLQGDFTSGFERSVEYTQKVDNGEISRHDFSHNGLGGGGYGLMQWTYPTRKAGLYDLAQEECLSVGDAFIQVEWLVRELWQPEFKPVLEILQNSVSIRDCSDVLVKKYLRPADQSEAVCAYRAKLGREFYQEFADGEAEDPDGQPDTVEVSEEEYAVMTKCVMAVKMMKDILNLMEEIENE